MRQNILAGIQIVISLVLIFAVLIQQRGTGIGSLFGGGGSMGGGEFFRSRRGVEKLMTYVTIVMGAFLVITSFLFLFL
jgi:protein translocase SecG subunit